MAKVPWRLQGDIPLGVSDPEITVFLGDVWTNSEDEQKVDQSTADPVVMKLSELAAMIVDTEALAAKQREQHPKTLPAPPPT